MNVEGLEKLRQPDSAGTQLLKLATQIANGEKSKDKVSKNEKKYFRTFKMRAFRTSDNVAVGGSVDLSAVKIAAEKMLSPLWAMITVTL